MCDVWGTAPLIVRVCTVGVHGELSSVQMCTIIHIDTRLYFGFEASLSSSFLELALTLSLCITVYVCVQKAIPASIVTTLHSLHCRSP